MTEADGDTAAEHRERKRLMQTISWKLRRAGIRDREDRMELARKMFTLPEEFNTYNDLTLADLRDLAFLLEGNWVLSQLQYANGTTVALARELLRRLEEPADTPPPEPEPEPTSESAVPDLTAAVCRALTELALADGLRDVRNVQADLLSALGVPDGVSVDCTSPGELERVLRDHGYPPSGDPPEGA